MRGRVFVMESCKGEVLIIDGTNLIHRNYYIHQDRRTINGIYTGGLYGVVRSLKSYIKNFNPKQMFICFDKSERTFRHKVYADYKATRKETDVELKTQFQLFEKFCKLANIPFVEKELYEADDLMGSLCCNAYKYNIKPYAVTGDKDLFQLIDKGVEVIYLSRKGPVIYGEKEFIEEYGLNTSQYLDYKALVGDTSDNIPGVPGVGDKTAKKLLKQYNTLDELYKNTDKLKGKQKERIVENKQNAYLFKDILTIKCDISLDYDKYFIDYIGEGFDLESTRVKKFLSNLEIN